MSDEITIVLTRQHALIVHALLGSTIGKTAIDLSVNLGGLLFEEEDEEDENYKRLTCELNPDGFTLEYKA
jgi:chemotaxis receptor (MCP) glutamine deamidase CheD